MKVEKQRKSFHNYTNVVKNDLDTITNLGLKFIPNRFTHNSYARVVLRDWYNFTNTLRNNTDTPHATIEYIHKTRKSIKKFLERESRLLKNFKQTWKITLR